jgi:hypothetical protein
VICQPDALHRLGRAFFPDAPPSLEWCARLSAACAECRVEDVDVIRYFHALSLHRHGLASEDAAMTTSLARSFGRFDALGSDVVLVVQATTSERWIERILDFYVENSVAPVFTLDGATSDATRDVLAARRAACVDITREPPSDAHHAVFRATGARWILRLYDDELPTPGLMAFVSRAVTHSSAFVWGFPRAYCWYDVSRDELTYSQFLTRGPLAGSDLQWRLMARPSGATERRAATAGAMVLSFDWVARTFLERVMRVETDARSEGTSRSIASLCLFEAVPEDWHMLAPLRDERLEELARRLHHSRTDASAA